MFYQQLNDLPVSDIPHAMCVMYILNHTDMHIQIHTADTCIHTYIHTYMDTYMHACMHTYIHIMVHTYIPCLSAATSLGGEGIQLEDKLLEIMGSNKFSTHQLSTTQGEVTAVKNMCE